MSAPPFPWLRLTLSTVGIIGVGYMIMKATVPTPEQTYAAMSPDLRRKVDANRAARLARETATKAQENAQSIDPDSQKPIWADKPRP
ncbi:hypothetical protein BD309DRAFT_950630 [Dichomitus squalens]|uniref:Assembly factor CBP4 n=1 Tax=Dichomitus squalens TaxID=114155 RepID=A0A4Q9MWA7_9APHY|nr:hypothetical protein BD311DRAFT_750753 [Dichomitus squalens]TBU47975.1 hypothetical protein BD309DRAFT_950630 [Dichomitus squalens]TBU66045.1 hypothetical protein BD310DRAFT_865383 [Dichomitus squalens]